MNALPRNKAGKLLRGELSKRVTRKTKAAGVICQ